MSIEAASFARITESQQLETEWGAFSVQDITRMLINLYQLRPNDHLGARSDEYRKVCEERVTSTLNNFGIPEEHRDHFLQSTQVLFAEEGVEYKLTEIHPTNGVVIHSRTEIQK